MHFSRSGIDRRLSTSSTLDLINALPRGINPDHHPVLLSLNGYSDVQAASDDYQWITTLAGAAAVGVVLYLLFGGKK